jgi:hypothetical protein
MEIIASVIIHVVLAYFALGTILGLIASFLDFEM